MKLAKNYDAGYKELFSNKQNILWFMLKVINNPKLNFQLEDVEIVATESINKRWKNRKSDMVYKIRYKETYYCLTIEFQSSPCQDMLLRLYEYMLLIQKKYRLNEKVPVVIPIILYNGIRRWELQTQYQELIEHSNDFLEFAQKFDCIFVDIKDIPEETLVNASNVLAIAIYIDQVSNNQEKMIERLLNLRGKTKLDEEQKQELAEWLYNVILKPYHIPEEEINEIFKKSGLEVDDMFSSTALKIKQGIEEEKKKAKASGIKEGMKEGMKQGMKQGMKRAITAIAKQMLMDNMPIETIAKYTGLKPEEIEKLRK